MDISARSEFAADPATVFTMLTDRAFLERVCEASRAHAYEVAVTGDTTRTERTLSAPEAAARFTGPTLTVVEEIGWDAPDASGARSGVLTMSVPGQPVSVRGSVQLTAASGGSVLDLSGELKVSVPLVGRTIEKSAAPAVLAGFRTQQEVGREWLASH